jgi:hypothetical protein
MRGATCRFRPAMKLSPIHRARLHVTLFGCGVRHFAGRDSAVHSLLHGRAPNRRRIRQPTTGLHSDFTMPDGITLFATGIKQGTGQPAVASLTSCRNAKDATAYLPDEGCPNSYAALLLAHDVDPRLAGRAIADTARMAPHAASPSWRLPTLPLLDASPHQIAAPSSPTRQRRSSATTPPERSTLGSPVRTASPIRIPREPGRHPPGRSGGTRISAEAVGLSSSGRAVLSYGCSAPIRCLLSCGRGTGVELDGLQWLDRGIRPGAARRGRAGVVRLAGAGASAWGVWRARRRPGGPRAAANRSRPAGHRAARAAAPRPVDRLVRVLAPALPLADVDGETYVLTSIELWELGRGA